MKKMLFVLGSALILTACAGSNDIGASRGLNSSRVTQAELDQYNKQRANEVLEARTQAEKARGYSDTIKSVSEAASSVTDTIRNVRSVFGF